MFVRVSSTFRWVLRYLSVDLLAHTGKMFILGENIFPHQWTFQLGAPVNTDLARYAYKILRRLGIPLRDLYGC